MALIPRTFGEGGAHLTSGDSSGKPSLKEILHDIADDLAAVHGGNGAPAITAPALGAFSDPPTAQQMADLRTLVNQLRAFAVGSSGATLKTTKG